MWSDRLEAVEARLAALAAWPVPSMPTDADAGGEERWDARRVWAHIGEFGDYWIDQLSGVLTSDEETPSFGRVKSDPARVAAIETGKSEPVDEHLARARAAMARVRALLSLLDAKTWKRQGRHPTLGLMDVERQLDEFLIGHWEQHAAQLETLYA